MKIRTSITTVVVFTGLMARTFLAPLEVAAATTVFTTDFESGVPSEFSAPGAATEPVQGYAGLGNGGNVFAGNFLRYDDTGVLDTTLNLSNLPVHDRLGLGFLLGVIDSWDGTELLEVRVDGHLLFSNYFQLATGDSSSYVAPPGALLSSGTDLGFSSGSYYGRDRAYDMSREPAFQTIAHSADTVAITWSLGATGGSAAENWQGDGDESWAIDNVVVKVETVTGRCSQPVTSGVTPTATDCLYILKTAVGNLTCDFECICAPKGSLPIVATDALVCLKKATGIAVELSCPCGIPTTTTTISASTTTTLPANLGQMCASDAECTGGLKCCYPCGIPGCVNECTISDAGGLCPLFP